MCIETPFPCMAKILAATLVSHPLCCVLQEAIMGAEEKGSHKERVEAMQKKFDVRHSDAYSVMSFSSYMHTCPVT